MNEEIKRWTAKSKTVLVLEIILGKTSVSEASGSVSSDCSTGCGAEIVQGHPSEQKQMMTILSEGFIFRGLVATAPGYTTKFCQFIKIHRFREVITLNFVASLHNKEVDLA